MTDGARVIEVEPPAGDLSRFSVPRHGPISGCCAQQVDSLLFVNEHAQEHLAGEDHTAQRGSIVAVGRRHGEASTTAWCSPRLLGQQRRRRRCAGGLRRAGRPPAARVGSHRARDPAAHEGHLR